MDACLHVQQHQGIEGKEKIMLLGDMENQLYMT